MNKYDNLLSIVGRIREVLGVGRELMLSELPDAIQKKVDHIELLKSGNVNRADQNKELRAALRGCLAVIKEHQRDQYGPDENWTCQHTVATARKLMEQP